MELITTGHKVITECQLFKEETQDSLAMKVVRYPFMAVKRYLFYYLSSEDSVSDICIIILRNDFFFFSKFNNFKAYYVSQSLKSILFIIVMPNNSHEIPANFENCVQYFEPVICS